MAKTSNTKGKYETLVWWVITITIIVSIVLVPLLSAFATSTR